MAEETRPPEPPPLPVPLGEEELRHADGRIEHPHVQYEPRDAKFGWVLGLIIGAIGLGAFLQYLVWAFFAGYGKHESVVKQSPYPLAAVPLNGPPREPRFEQVERLLPGTAVNVQPPLEEGLHRYGRVPGESGYVRIPIEEAMRLVVKELPVRKTGPPEDDPRADGLRDYGESNSGRMFRKKAP
jgi:hypothetical protein